MPVEGQSPQPHPQHKSTEPGWRCFKTHRWAAALPAPGASLRTASLSSTQEPSSHLDLTLSKEVPTAPHNLPPLPVAGAGRWAGKRKYYRGRWGGGTSHLQGDPRRFQETGQIMSPYTPSFSKVWEPRCGKNLIHPTPPPMPTRGQSGRESMRMTSCGCGCGCSCPPARMGHPGGG